MEGQVMSIRPISLELGMRLEHTMEHEPPREYVVVRAKFKDNNRREWCVNIAVNHVNLVSIDPYQSQHDHWPYYISIENIRESF